VAAAVLLTLRGTPFLYAGEELGLEDTPLGPAERVDPGGRDGCRAPIPWTPGPSHGWPAPPWLPFPPDSGARNVATQAGDPGSILCLYRRLVEARRASPALHDGSCHLLRATTDLVVYERRADHDRRVVVANFGPTRQRAAVPGDWTIDVATDHRRDGTPWDGAIDVEQAAVLRPPPPR
jgi:alpha-glucosidase